MDWMLTSKSWVLWKQQESLLNTTSSKNLAGEKLKSLLIYRWWSPTGREGKPQGGSKKNRQRATTETDRALESELGEEAVNKGWTGGVRHKDLWRFGQVKLAQSRATMECWISGWFREDAVLHIVVN